MSLRLLHFPALAALGLMLAACASGPKVDPAVTSAASTRGVEQSTLNKMVGGQVLDYGDILDLVQRRVPSNIIVGYLTSTRKVYNLSYGQLQTLKSAGASAQ